MRKWNNRTNKHTKITKKKRDHVAEKNALEQKEARTFSLAEATAKENEEAGQQWHKANLEASRAYQESLEATAENIKWKIKHDQTQLELNKVSQNLTLSKMGVESLMNELKTKKKTTE